jgi:hypothetical protein
MSWLQLPIFQVVANIFSLLLINLATFPSRMLQERRERRHLAKESLESMKEKYTPGVIG